MKTFRFDNGVSGDLALTFARNNTAGNEDGSLSTANTPRYAGFSRLLASAAAITTLNATEQNNFVWTGYDGDGTRRLVCWLENNPARLDVYQDQYGGTQLSTRALVVAAGAKEGLEDLSYLSADERDDYRWEVEGMVVCHGLLIAYCVVYKDTSVGGDWSSDDPAATGILYSNDGGDTWLEGYLGADRNISNNRGNFWACSQWFEIDRQLPPLEAWIPWVDYDNEKNGGVLYLTRVSRAAVGDAWTVHDTQLLLTIDSGTAPDPGPQVDGNTHFHSAIVVRHGSGGVAVEVHVGDTQVANCVIRLYRSDENYTEGAASATDGATLNGWTTVYGHGSADPTGVTTAQQFGMQGVAVCPLANPQEFLIGSDEFHPSFIKRVCANDVTPNNWGYEYLDGVGCSVGQLASNVFSIQAVEPQAGGPYWAFLLHASGIGSEYTQRVMYSLDGNRWTSVAMVRSATTDMVAPQPDGCLIGSRLSLGLRKVATPSIRECFPLLIGRGGTDYLGTITHSGKSTSVTSVTEIARVSIPAHIPPPPCPGTIWKVVATTGGAGINVGEFALMAGASLPKGVAKATFYVYLETPADDATAPGGGCVPRVRMRNVATPSEAEAAYVGEPVMGAGRWIEFTHEADTTFATPDPFQAALHFQVGLFRNLATYYLAFGPVTGHATAVDPIGYCGEAGVGTLADEVASVGHSTLACREQWTAGVSGLIPRLGWDWRSAVANAPYLVTFWQSATKYVEIYYDHAADALKAFVKDGAVTETLTLVENCLPERGDSVNIAITHSGRITIAADVGGNSLGDVSTVSEFYSIRPAGATAIRFSNNDQTKVGSMEWCEGFVDEGSAVVSPGTSIKIGLWNRGRPRGRARTRDRRGMAAVA